jgi:hypothetical protein
MEVDISKLIGDHFSEKIRLLEDDAKKKVDDRLVQFDEHEREARDKFDSRMRALEERLTGDVRSRVFQIALAVVGIAAATMLLGSFAATKEVNNSVIALQKDLIAAQTTIRTADKELRDQMQVMATATAALTAKQADLGAAEAKYRDEASRLADLKRQYEDLLKGAKAVKSP